MSETPPPSVLPIFPLTGSLLLPGTWLPLHVFETRYRHMVEDALEGERFVGMIQPREPRREDNHPDPDAPPENPEVYAIGCAGRIVESRQEPDGRYLILLEGVCRFRVLEELPLVHGYRRVVAGYEPFAADREEPATDLDRASLFSSLDSFAVRHGLSFDRERLESMPGVALLNGLAVALPFSPGEKQALLEAEGPQQRQELLLTLLGMGIDPSAADPAPPVN